MSLPDFKFDGPEDAETVFAFAHGAGIGMSSEFMDAFAVGLGARGIRVARFEFPYMQIMNQTGTRRPPDRAPVLLDTFRAVADHLGRRRTLIGGKSMGGRIASMLAAEIDNEDQPVKGCVCLGYPFHPPKDASKVRTAHLDTLMTPTLILQGTRDPFGTSAEVPAYSLSKAIQLHWLEDGDHHLTPRKKSGVTQDENWTSAMDRVAAFATSLG